MAMKRCPVCGERYSDTYKYCPFCEEDEVAQEEEPRRGAPSRGGRRSAAPRAASGRQPNLVTPTLVVLILFMAALLVYLLWGDKIADKFKKDDPADGNPGVQTPIEPDKPTVQDPPATDPGAAEPGADDPGTSDPGTADPGTVDPGATEPGGNMPDTPDTSTTTPPASGGATSYETADALPGGLTLNKRDFTRSTSETPVQLKVSGGSGTYTWISQDPGIASVDSSGNVTPISAGTTNVLVTDGSRKAVCIVRVTGGRTTTTPSTTPATGQPAASGGTLKTGKAVVINGGNGVRVRSGPGTDHDILATIPNGGSVQVVADAGNGWYEITFTAVGGVTTTGYMKGDYLSNG